MVRKIQKYFLGLEKRNQSNKYIKSLIDEEGKHISNKEEILKEHVKFYSKLYETRNSFEN